MGERNGLRGAVGVGMLLAVFPRVPLPTGPNYNISGTVMEVTFKLWQISGTVMGVAFTLWQTVYTNNGRNYYFD